MRELEHFLPAANSGLFVNVRREYTPPAARTWNAAQSEYENRGPLRLGRGQIETPSWRMRMAPQTRPYIGVNTDFLPTHKHSPAQIRLNMGYIDAILAAHAAEAPASLSSDTIKQIRDETEKNLGRYTRLGDKIIRNFVQFTKTY